MKLQASSFFSTLTKKIGIDLGTSRLRVWSDQEGFILDEPTCIAVDVAQGKVLAVGSEAQEMVGRVNPGIEVSHPLEAGRVSRPELVTAMLKVFLQKVFVSPYFFRPLVMVSIPANLTDVEKQALTDILYSLGAREVYFMYQLLAGAIGAGVPVADASGSFLLQLGGGVAEGGIISLGSLIVNESNEYAGNYLDEAIQRVLRKEMQIDVGHKSVEQIKTKLVSFREHGGNGGKNPRVLHVTGQDILESVPKEVEVHSEIFTPILQQLLEKYVRLVRKLFEQTPSELTSDVIDKGVLLCGGLAQLDGLDAALLAYLGVPVSVVEDPERAVIKGIAQVLQNLELFKESIGYRSS